MISTPGGGAPRRGATEVTQDQVMVVVVTCVSDRHVLDHMTVCAQDVVDPGVHHPSSAVHAPCPAVLQPRLML